MSALKGFVDFPWAAIVCGYGFRAGGACKRNNILMENVRENAREMETDNQGGREAACAQASHEWKVCRLMHKCNDRELSARRTRC
ncbi:MAG: hypothetical protein HBSIN02_12820 [Bacteroidia bacterium]|nr:MAG: hypothetical protein HBSIN02_12820 [Bacteroidia bacterium]